MPKLSIGCRIRHTGNNSHRGSIGIVTYANVPAIPGQPQYIVAWYADGHGCTNEYVALQAYTSDWLPNNCEVLQEPERVGNRWGAVDEQPSVKPEQFMVFVPTGITPPRKIHDTFEQARQAAEYTLRTAKNSASTAHVVKIVDTVNKRKVVTEVMEWEGS